MTCTLQQLLAASALIVRLERICSSGVLSESEEADTRVLICRAYREFALPSVAERPSNVIRIGDHDPEYARSIETITRIMGE